MKEVRKFLWHLTLEASTEGSVCYAKVTHWSHQHTLLHLAGLMCVNRKFLSQIESHHYIILLYATLNDIQLLNS